MGLDRVLHARKPQACDACAGVDEDPASPPSRRTEPSSAGKPCGYTPEVITYGLEKLIAYRWALKRHQGRHIMVTHIDPRDVVERRTVAGLLPDRARAEQTIDALKAAGFTGDQIGVALRDRTAQGVLLEDTGTQVAEEAATTEALGGGLLGASQAC